MPLGKLRLRLRRLVQGHHHHRGTCGCRLGAGVGRREAASPPPAATQEAQASARRLAAPVPALGLSSGPTSALTSCPHLWALGSRRPGTTGTWGVSLDGLGVQQASEAT